MMIARSDSCHRRRGAVALFVALCMTVLVGIIALAVDGGLLLTEQRHAQSTADAAAMAAATVLYANYPAQGGVDQDSTARNAAFALAADNGYTNDGSTSTVVVNVPPLTGPYTGMSGYAEVTVTYYQQRTFGTIFGSGVMPIRARAVARGAWIAPNAGVIVLDYSGKGTLNVQGNGAATETGAPIIVNSNNPSAALDTGNGVLKAPEFDITGGYTITGNGLLITSPTPNNIFTGVHPTPDPLAYLPVPTLPVAGTITKTTLQQGNFQYVLTPGSFINLPNFSTGDEVIFTQGGIYYLTSGGLSSQGATLALDSATTGGIMIYNAGTGTNDKIDITGNSDGSVSLSPLTTGPYAGITFWQARDAAQDLQIAGNGSFNISGTLYAPAALVKVTGNGAVSNIGSQYITKDLSLAGNGNISLNYVGSQVGRTRVLALVE